MPCLINESALVIHRGGEWAAQSGAERAVGLERDEVAATNNSPPRRVRDDLYQRASVTSARRTRTAHAVWQAFSIANAGAITRRGTRVSRATRPV